MKMPSVYFCTACGNTSYQNHASKPPVCCPDSDIEFVTEELAQLAKVGYEVIKLIDIKKGREDK